MNSLLKLCFASLIVVAGLANAAQFSVHDRPAGVEIEGTIEKGDFERFAKFLIEQNAFNNFVDVGVFLNSLGGNVSEALLFANLIDKSFSSTFVPNGAKCASACTLLWAAGISRSIDNGGAIGVHRISLKTDDVDVRKLDKTLQPVALKLDDFLKQMGVPRLIIDKMNETSSSDIFWINNDWLIQQDLWSSVQYRPRFLDVAASKCGKDPFAAAMRNNSKLDKASANSWLLCVDQIQTKNKEMAYVDVYRSVLKLAGQPYKK